MTESWWFNLLVTLLIIAASGFFVIIEFSLMGARRHRLEEYAENSRTARAGLRSLNELTIMLAGAQLGITAATFVLGAVTKPWVHHLLMAPLKAVGLPLGIADVASFILALFVVTFLHLVLGEMAPKSWAIAHPETALQVIAVPARGFVWIFRPLLKWINVMANKLVAMAGEEPVDRAGAAGYDAETLRTLVEHSRETGALDDDSANQISDVIELENSTVGAMARAHGSEVVPLPSDATVDDLQDLVVRKNIMRVLVFPKDSRVPRVVTCAIPCWQLRRPRSSSSPAPPCPCLLLLPCKRPWTICGPATSSSSWWVRPIRTMPCGSLPGTTSWASCGRRLPSS